MPPKGFHIMTKPAGPACNLDCKYCFYTEKSSLFGDCGSTRMSDEVLEAFVIKYISSQSVPEVAFAWQGGEPLLMGLDFFKNVIELQKKYAQGKRITNSMQTNGTLLTDEWCEFLAANEFLVGLSMDGPEGVHNQYRVDRSGQPTFDAVKGGLKLLKKHGVEFNILACVNNISSKKPLDVYRFFKRQGAQFIQFIPIVERWASVSEKEAGLKLSYPPNLQGAPEEKQVTPWSVEPGRFGDFMIRVFDEWVQNDIGSMFVMNFEWTLSAWMGISSGICSFARTCGDCLAMEHNGDIYACDHYVYPEYKLGNILTHSPHELLGSNQQMEFGSLKETALPKQCLDCPALRLCRGECPKHRFMKAEDGEPALNYLCAGYRKYFEHVDPYMKIMAQRLERGLPVENISSL
ncbi:MAG: anaerobic sulfatase maturase [Armatimonadetes bacterium]|nr:anaerobic sulfatase maturase [Armatimonadota bacterium]